jgi:hypothetical protein
MDLETVEGLIPQKEWHFAKSMPKIPHYYARKSEWGNDEEFLAVAKFMRDNSVGERFFRTTFYYFYAGPWKYWTMDKDVADVEIINRAMR